MFITIVSVIVLVHLLLRQITTANHAARHTPNPSFRNYSRIIASIDEHAQLACARLVRWLVVDHVRTATWSPERFVDGADPREAI